MTIIINILPSHPGGTPGYLGRPGLLWSRGGVGISSGLHQTLPGARAATTHACPVTAARCQWPDICHAIGCELDEVSGGTPTPSPRGHLTGAREDVGFRCPVTDGTCPRPARCDVYGCLHDEWLAPTPTPEPEGASNRRPMSGEQRSYWIEVEVPVPTVETIRANAVSAAVPVSEANKEAGDD